MQTISFFSSFWKHVASSVFFFFPVFWNFILIFLALGIFISFSGHSAALFIWKLVANGPGKSWIGVRKFSVSGILVTRMLELLNWFFNYFISFLYHLSRRFPQAFNLSIEFLISTLMFLIPWNSSLFSEWLIPLL